LQELATSLGVGDRIRLTGVLDSPSLAFGAADVIAVPSKQPDPFPNAALEAAAAGCCVVGANHGGIPEIIEDGRTGVLFEPGSTHALATALAELGDDPARRERLGAAAAQDVNTRFSKDALLSATQALYDRLL
jgi:glycosyltransferase involved in cell wall biosynthesis